MTRTARVLLLALCTASACTTAPAGPVATPTTARATTQTPSSPAAFRVEVVGSGPPMILIPGLTCGGDVWAETAAHYRGTHQLHVVTLAGFAGEPRIAAPMLERVRDELVAYIAAQHLEHPVVVGHSLGGFMALWIAATAPDAVGPVVAVDGVPFLPALMDPSATADSSRAAAEQMRTAMAAMTPEAFASQNRSGLAQMIIDPKDVDAVATIAGRSDPTAVGDALSELMVTDIRPQLTHVQTPVLVLAAAEYAKDAGAQAEVRARYERQLDGVPHGRVVLATNAKHFIMLDDPAFFFAELDRVLAGAT